MNLIEALKFQAKHGKIQNPNNINEWSIKTGYLYSGESAATMYNIRLFIPKIEVKQ